MNITCGKVFGDLITNAKVTLNGNGGISTISRNPDGTIAETRVENSGFESTVTYNHDGSGLVLEVKTKKDSRDREIEEIKKRLDRLEEKQIQSPLESLEKAIQNCRFRDVPPSARNINIYLDGQKIERIICKK